MQTKYNTEKGCRFVTEYAYNHSTQHDKSKPCECKSKINILAKIVREMTKKIIDHENKIENMWTLVTEDSELKGKVKLREAVV